MIKLVFFITVLIITIKSVIASNQQSNIDEIKINKNGFFISVATGKAINSSYYVDPYLFNKVEVTEKNTLNIEYGYVNGEL